MKEITINEGDQKLSLWMIIVRKSSKRQFKTKSGSSNNIGIVTQLVAAISEEEALEGFHSIFYNETNVKVVGIVNVTNEYINNESHKDVWVESDGTTCIKNESISNITKDLILKSLSKIIYFDYRKDQWAIEYFDHSNMDILNIINIEKCIIYYVTYDRKDLINDSTLVDIVSNNFTLNAALTYDFIPPDCDLELISEFLEKDNASIYNIFIVSADEISVKYLQELKTTLEKIKIISNISPDYSYYPCSLYVVSDDELYSIPLNSNNLILQSISEKCKILHHKVESMNHIENS